MRRATRWILAVLVLAAGTPGVEAGAIFTTFEAWQAAGGAIETETFNSYTANKYPTFPAWPSTSTVGTINTGKVKIEVSSGGSLTGVVTSGSSYSAYNADGTPFALLEPAQNLSGTRITPLLVFNAPVRAFAADWTRTSFVGRDPLYGAKANFTVGGETLRFEDYLGSPGTGFLGFVSDTAFSRIDFGTVIPPSPTSGYSNKYAPFGMDNLRFAASLATPTVAPVVNASFALGSALDGTSGWTADGPGTAAVVADPTDPTNGVAQLKTGSPISITQAVSTFAGPFVVAFDYLFQTTTGTLQVFLNDVLIGELAAPAALTGTWDRHFITVTDPSLIGLSGKPLRFTFDGQTGSEILIDDVSITAATPEPGALALMGLGGVGMAFAGWRKKRKATVTL